MPMQVPMPMSMPVPVQVQVQVPVQVPVQVHVVVENRASKYPCRHCRIQSLSLLSGYYTICLPLYAFAFERMDNRGFCWLCNNGSIPRSGRSRYSEGGHMKDRNRNRNRNSQTFFPKMAVFIIPLTINIY